MRGVRYAGGGCLLGETAWTARWRSRSGSAILYQRPIRTLSAAMRTLSHGPSTTPDKSSDRHPTRRHLGTVAERVGQLVDRHTADRLPLVTHQVGPGLNDRGVGEGVECIAEIIERIRHLPGVGRHLAEPRL